MAEKQKKNTHQPKLKVIEIGSAGEAFDCLSDAEKQSFYRTLLENIQKLQAEGKNQTKKVE